MEKSFEKELVAGNLAVIESIEENPLENADELELKRGLFNFDIEEEIDKFPNKSLKAIFFAIESENAAIPKFVFPSLWANLNWPTINLKSIA
ncbi:MAG: hypothetical protein K6C97_05600 [Treponema sp.]|nr:hypothetical protein [Treponema sp.]